ncbi:MAG TPA: GNAT family N-acetyltransferase [Caulobacteraceae bacterium]|nr:GNAT family N-acetyltransferase [Caulobacteraceae bacterium]
MTADVVTDAAALEPITDRAWPPLERARLGGWRLNASTGFSGRLNTCWPLGRTGREAEASIDFVEAWLRARGLPPMFKLAPAAVWPADLAERLARRGYRSHTETLLMVGPAKGAAATGVTLSRDWDDDFAAVFTGVAADPGDAMERLAALRRVPQPRRLAVARVDARAAAIGACAIEGSWVGIFAMRTLAQARRQGLGRSVLSSLLAAGAEAGAQRAWLQVEAVNAGAIALYEAAGFMEAYRYAYWTLE